MYKRRWTIIATLYMEKIGGRTILLEFRIDTRLVDYLSRIKRNFSLLLTSRDRTRYHRNQLTLSDGLKWLDVQTPLQV